MTPETELLALVRRGHALMARERACLARGAIREVAALSGEKLALLDSLGVAIARVRGTDDLRAALNGLIADSRRNERIILAARQGITAARRRIENILATCRGAVAYDRDGATIASRADAIRKSSRA